MQNSEHFAFDHAQNNNNSVRHSADTLNHLVLLLRFSLGTLFVWSSVWKIYQPYEFLRDVYNYDLVGAVPGYYAAALLPWLELVIGFALVMNSLVRGASLLSVSLLIIFLCGQAHSLLLGLDIPCGCFSANGESISYLNILTTGTALVAALVVSWSECRRRTVDA